jgi:outer membrane receptor protein involved in Fe transport
LTIAGVATEDFGDYRLPRLDRLNNWQYGDTVFVNRGIHSIRFGFDFQRIQFNQHTANQVGGLLTFTSLANFLQGIPSQFDFAVPGGIDPDRGFRQSVFASFAQDDIRVRKNLAINLGLRYEFSTVPTEVNSKISNLRYVSDPAVTVGGSWFANPSLKDFAPRVGIAWDPFSTGRTSVRAGFGSFYDEILPKYYVFSGSTNPPLCNVRRSWRLRGQTSWQALTRTISSINCKQSIIGCTLLMLSSSMRAFSDRCAGVGS